MKKSALAYLLLFALVFSFGCKKDDKESTTSGLSVKIDGSVWSPSINVGVYFTSMNTTMLTGSDVSTGSQLIIGFKGNDTGTFVFTADDEDSYCSYSGGSGVDDGYCSYFTDTPSGQIIITEVDKVNHTISGSFHFDGYTLDGLKKTFTEGKFNKIAFQVQ
jgi:hypothetical protein